MRYHFEVVVRLKSGLLDPQGKAIEDSLPHQRWNNVSDVRVGKHIEFDVEASDHTTAEKQVGEMSNKLLANPVIEDVSFSWRSMDDGSGRVELGMGS